MSSSASAADEQDDSSLEIISFPSTPPSPSHPEAVAQAVAMHNTPNIEILGDVPDVSEGEDVAGPSLISLGTADYHNKSIRSEAATEMHEPDGAIRGSRLDIFEGAPARIGSPFESISGNIGDSLPQVSNSSSNLSAAALLFPPSSHSSYGDNGSQSSFEAQSELSSPSTPISQISAIAAEVADTAAMLDATPIRATTPELQSILDDIGSVGPRSPVVELVEEDPFTPMSEAAKIAAEVADTAAMLDYSPDGQFVVGPGPYITEQSPEEMHIGAIRIVQITDVDGDLAPIEQFAVIGSDDEGSEDGPEEYPSKEETSKAIDLVHEGHIVPTVERGQLASVDHNSQSLTNARVFRQNPASETPSTPTVAGISENVLDRRTKMLLEAPEQFFDTMTTKVGLDSLGHENSREQSECYPNIPENATTKAFEAIEDDSKAYSTETTGPQKDAGSLIPPHLRKKFEPKGHLDISDSANLRLDQLERIYRFIDSICVEDLVAIAVDMYSDTYDIASSMFNCTVTLNPRISPKNVFYVAEFSKQGTVQKDKWMIRVPLLGRSLGDGEKLWLESDIRAMEFIKERTDIPVPYIYGFENSIENIIGTPYVLMEFMDGDRVEDVWENWTEEKRMLCLSQCAEFMRKLGRFGFDSIGVLGCDYKKGEYIVDGIPPDTKGRRPLAGPFESTKAYLDHAWSKKAMCPGDDGNSEEVKDKQFLILLKLLIPALVDLEPETQHFFLSLPEFGGKNVLVDRDGNVTGFVGWEKVMIMPKEMGYARYPDWIMKDWISRQGKSQVDPQQRGGKNTKAKAIQEINRKSLAKASLNSGKAIETVTDNEGIIRGYLLEEVKDGPREMISDPKLLASLPRSKKSESGNSTGAGDDSMTDIDETTYFSTIATPQSLPSIYVSTDCSLPEEDPPVNSGLLKKNKKGGREGSKNRGNKKNNRGNRQHSVARQRQECHYDESIDLQRATTDEDKIKIDAVSKWNALPDEITQKEAEERKERKERKRVRLAKEEEDKIAGIKKETVVLPKVVETFKKVVVEQNLERKLLGVVRTERRDPLDDTISMEDIKSTIAVNYRKIYYEFFTKIAPEDGIATKFSHISTAVHTAITNHDLRPFIVPRLARYVFGATVGPNLLKMVGNGQWAQELLARIPKGDKPKKSLQPADECGQVCVEGKGKKVNGKGWGHLILRSNYTTGTILVAIALLTFISVFNPEYTLQFNWHENGYISTANLNFRLQLPMFSQSSNYETIKTAAQIFGDTLGKAPRAANVVLNYSITLVGAIFLFVVFLTMQSRTDVAVE